MTYEPQTCPDAVFPVNVPLITTQTNRPRYPGELCHVCASPDVAYWHTIHPADRPYAMVNVGYCKRCAELLDRFEQDLYKWITEAKE